MTMTRRVLSKGVLAATVQAACLLSSRSAFATANVFSSQVEDRTLADEFEVATIKPINPAGGNLSGVDIAADGVLSIGSVSLRTLISVAWNAGYWQVDEPPAEWMTKTEFNIQAKPPELPSQEIYSQRHSWFSIEDPRLRKMLQATLIDRFQLKLYTEQRNGPVYILERDDHAALKLIPLDKTQYQADSPGTIGKVAGRGFSIHNMSMHGLAKALGDYVYHRPVLDHTGLTGIYNFESKTLIADYDIGTQATDPLFLAAVKEMGLKTKQVKGMGEYFVIDSASLPSPN